MKIDFLTETNMINLGIYDDIKNLYDDIYDSCRNAINKCQNDNEMFAVIHNIDEVYRNILDDFFKKYTYVFTDECTRLCVNVPAARNLFFISIKDHPSKPLGLIFSFSTFKKFVKNLEHVSVMLVWWNKQKQLPKISYENIRKQICQHIENLVTKSISNNETDSLQAYQDEELIIYNNLTAIECNVKKHRLSNQRLTVYTLNDSPVSLTVHRCLDCGKVFLGKETLLAYERVVGKLLIRTLDTIEKSKNNDAYSSFKLQSELYSWGYNVQKEGLSEKERQDLLINLLNKNKITLFAMRRDIEKAINIFKHHPQFALALKKWKSDLEFINEYVESQQLSDDHLLF